MNNSSLMRGGEEYYSETFPIYNFQWVTEGLLLLIVSIIGIVGNACSVVTCTKQRIQRVFHRLLLALATFDTVSSYIHMLHYIPIFILWGLPRLFVSFRSTSYFEVYLCMPFFFKNSIASFHKSKPIFLNFNDLLAVNNYVILTHTARNFWKKNLTKFIYNLSCSIQSSNVWKVLIF